MRENEIAILMAAGMGTRMRPLTETTPKPLIKVHGVPMIETVIEALEERGVSHIYIVVGYLGSQFSYLEKNYVNISIVENKEYLTINNISSIHAVTDIMRGHDCLICEADLYIPDKMALSGEHDQSCYYGIYTDGYIDDWVFDQDNNGFITRIGKGGEDCCRMCGISYFKENDARIIADAIDETYGKSGYEKLFWDEVVDSVLGRIRVGVFRIPVGTITEIDAVEELNEINSRSEGE